MVGLPTSMGPSHARIFHNMRCLGGQTYHACKREQCLYFIIFFQTLYKIQSIIQPAKLHNEYASKWKGFQLHNEYASKWKGFQVKPFSYGEQLKKSELNTFKIDS